MPRRPGESHLPGAALAAACLFTVSVRAAHAAPVLAAPASAPTSTPIANTFKPAPLFAASAISRRTLANGVRTTVKAAPDFDLVCVQVWVKGGSRAEGPTESGMAHLLELVATRGSKNFPATDDPDESGLVGAIRALGGASGALTSRDATFYSATVRSADFEKALTALADAVLRPDLSNLAVSSSAQLDATMLENRNFDSVTAASDIAYAATYAHHPYRRPTWGSEAALQGLTAPKVRAWHQSQYVAKNINVVVVGKVAPDAAHAAIERLFKDASAVVPPVVAPKPDTPNKGREITRRLLTARQCLSLAWPSAPVTKPKDVVAMDTLLSLWREGLDAPLRRALLRDGVEGPREPLVAAYDVDYLTQRDPGLFIISLSGVRDREAARTAVLNEVNRIRDKGVSEVELKRAKTLLRQQYIEQSENAAGQAGAFGFYEVITGGKFADDYLSLCAGVTADDLQRVARTYLNPAYRVEAEVVPLSIPLPQPPGGDDNVITASWKTPSAPRAEVSQ